MKVDFFVCQVQTHYLHYTVPGNVLTEQIPCVNEIYITLLCGEAHHHQKSHQVLVCTYRHAQLLGKKASTTEISELKIEGMLENSEFFFPQPWNYIPFLT